MAARFLSAEWAEQVTAAVRDHPGFGAAVEGVEFSVQFEIDQVPDEAAAHYYLEVAADDAVLAIGTLPQADLSVRTDYATASGISRGTLKIQSAFFSGKLAISGNVAKLLMNQRALDHLADAVSALEVEY
ncbi:MAG: SCP2 sterol-binding domain-containing protein [bacterium]|nr:SCP2 sterol-binding domain-containing protein [bacterium]MDE0353642.1 SCP2 sterol-binding domain-containing protein [bacterium]